MDVLQLSCLPRKALYWRGLIRHVVVVFRDRMHVESSSNSCPIMFRTAEACCDELQALTENFFE